MEILIILSTVAVVIWFGVLVVYVKKVIIASESDEQNTESVGPQENTLDLENVSDEHYLLEAGKNEWRLNTHYYGSSDSLLIYTLGYFFNQPVCDYEPILLESAGNRMRIMYLIDEYTDKKVSQEKKIKQLAGVLLQKRDALPANLQDDYNLQPQDNTDPFEHIVKTLTSIIEAYLAYNTNLKDK